MSKHRKKQPYRRIVIAAAAVGALGVPSIALACTDWPGGGEGQSHRAGAEATTTSWQHTDGGRRHGHGDRHGHKSAEPTPTASATATPTPSAPRHSAPKHSTPRHSTPSTGAPQHRTTAPTRTVHTTATPRHTAGGSSTAPKTTTAPTATATPSQSAPQPTATASGDTARVVQLVNAERAKVGCSPLTVNADLTKAAQAHSEDMAAHRNMSHTGSDGSSPGDRITRAGYTWSSYGENVAYGYSTPEQVMSAWMNSPGHRENILNCGYKEIGVGLAQPGSYWTQDFGTER
ncbi:CAP domain-containing protein [Streptomyces sp. NPDC006393]|uniref:CAP domain-containing protein n=1 Tax=Streptomyces sp. NPDC006393 TaxID=3156763 RepID=UPI0033CF7DC4